MKSLYPSDQQMVDILVAPAAGRGEIAVWVYRQRRAV